MHRSRLGGFIIDCRVEDLDAAAEFWSRALGFEREKPDKEQPQYLALNADEAGLHCEVQRVDHESRVHLDIEADDIEAEVARLEKIGAKRIEKIKSWVVMEAPTGQRFCVVRAQTPVFDAQANTWD